MKNKIHFVYVTTNIVTNKKYIGDHSTYDVNDNYLGSGIYIQRAINEYGKENFIREIIETFPTKQDAFNAQEKYIIKFNTLSPNGYNISPKGGHNVKNCFSNESKQRISLHRKGKCKGINHPNWNKSLSIKTKQKIGEKNKINSAGKSNGMFGKTQYNCWLTKFGKQKADELYMLWKINVGKSGKGKNKSVKAKENMKTAALNRRKYVCNHCGKLYDAGNLKRHEQRVETLRKKEKL